METGPLKSFATWARRELITQVSARMTAVLAPASSERVENQRAVAMLERDIAAAGAGTKSKDAVADKVAYTWFNRIVALRFMDANGYTGLGVVSPAHGQQTGQPEVLADAKRGSIDPSVVSNKRTRDTITGLLDGTRPSSDAQGEVYTLLLAEYCRYWNRSMPFMFEPEGDYTELLIPANLLAADSILTRAAAALTEDVCRDVEVIGWLYQFYISERKDEVFAGFKKGKKAGSAEIPAATQLFTPHWIVRYLVENSLGRLWVLNNPESRLIDQMDYYISPVDEETDFLRISSPEELTVIDPACGSGHMLTYAFDLLYEIYEEEGYAPSEIPALILSHNLYGTEIDPRAGALAAFVLTMKGRGKQRTFFNKNVEPNICVIGPVSFSPEELDFLSTKDGNHSDEEAFWDQFADADTLGSLIQPDPDLAARLKKSIAQLDNGGDFLRGNVLDRAELSIAQAEYLSHEYSVVVANPPYMGSGNMGSVLAAFTKSRFPASKSDLSAVFLERCAELCGEHGFLALITMQSWMFLTSLSTFRRTFLEKMTVATLAHLGTGAFDSISGEVVSTVATVLKKGFCDNTGVYVRLVDAPAELGKRSKLRLVARRRSAHDRFEVQQGTFLKIPDTPLAYWLSNAMLDALCAPKKFSDLAQPRKGLDSGKNHRFLRYWWEISIGRIGFGYTNGSSAKASGFRWFPHNKGGAFRKWWGNQEYVINWENDGSEIRSYGTEDGGRPRSRAQNTEYFFRASVSWSDISGGQIAFRLYPPGLVFDATGPSFPVEGTDASRIVAIGNSKVADALLGVIAPGTHFSVGMVGRIPLPNQDLEADTLVRVSELVRIYREDWACQETAWNFEGPAFRIAHGSLEVASLARFESARVTAARARALEIDNNRDVASLYGLSHEVNADVPLEQVALNTNLAFRYGKDANEETNRTEWHGDTVRELVSYALGCIFGRYSPEHPGLVLADLGATLDEYLAKVPSPTIMPAVDNVVPVVDGDWFEDDIVVRFRQFLRTAFGDEHFEENLRFVEESLEVKSFQDYFITRAGRSKFYDDHVKRYKKRPIYWLFSSPKGSFNALIYMHRYTPSTVSTVLNEYLREFETKLEANLQHQERLAVGDDTPREKAAALKEADRLRKVLLELGEYEHDVLYPLASQQIAIDLDDGVKANYPKFYPALRKIAGLDAADE